MNAVTLYNEIWSSASELEARCKQSLLAADGSLDMIWCRDVLNQVDLARGLAECARPQAWRAYAGRSDICDIGARRS